MWGRNKILRIALAAFAGAAAFGIAAFCAYMMWEQAPEVRPAPNVIAEPVEAVLPEEADDGVSRAEKGMPFDTKRRDGVYTMLLIGNDDGTGNTDTIMVGKIDTVRHSMSFVSIPRDTLINVDWDCRKINSVYWGAEYSGDSGIEALERHIRKLVGFDVDCYAIIDLGVFQEVVDTMGGVWFDVPQAMYYTDAGQELYIELEPGYQCLDGYQAMGLCRYRSSYVDGDIGRIQMQHEFLKALAEQFVAEGSIPNAAAVCELVADRTDTNMTAANIAYFFRQALMCSAEDINFYTAPNTPAYVHELSYTFLDLYDWLAMINECLNPFDTPVSEANLDLVYLHNGNVCCTTVLNGPGYYDLGRSESADDGDYAPEEEEPTEPEPTPAPTPRPYIELFPQLPPQETPVQTPSNDNWIEEF